MSQTAFRIPRHRDRELLTRLTKLASTSPLPQTSLQVKLYPNAQWTQVNPNGDWENQPGVKELLEVDQASLFSANVTGNDSGHNVVLTFERREASVVDDVKVGWPNSGGPAVDAKIALFYAQAQQTLGAVHFVEAAADPADERVATVHAAVLERLETAAARSIELTQQQLVKNEADLLAHKAALAAEVEAEKERLASIHQSRLADVQRLEEAVRAREQLIDQRDNRHARRDLLAKMLERVKEQEATLQLSEATQKKRWPVVWALVLMATALVAAFGYGLFQLSTALAGGNPWVIGGMIAKQAVIGGVLLGVAWWYVQWQDRWFREHADNEFRLKQLHLDFTRASWLVETALEWEEQEQQMPAALLDRLSTGLFTNRATDSGPTPAPPDLASLLLSNATSMEANVPGAKLVLDRSATRRVQAQLDKEAS